MKDARAAATGQPASHIMSELRVSGHLMMLDPGLFCIVQTPTPGADPTTGLPGVRLSLPPGLNGRPEAVRISGFGPDGWLSGTGDAALVRVSGGPAQLLVTIYQARETQDSVPPNIQVMRLIDPAAPKPVRPPIGAAAPVPAPAGMPAAVRAAKVMEIVAHIQERGDQGAMLGERLGEPGSKRWIEGFGIAPTSAIAPQDIEYQAVLGPGWLSPWVEGGQFCGSRGMALPVLGLRVRLRGDAAATHKVRYTASFVDGSQSGPVGDGEACESASLAAMESVLVELLPRVAAAPAKPAKAVEPVAARRAPPAPPPLVAKPKPHAKPDMKLAAKSKKAKR